MEPITFFELKQPAIKEEKESDASFCEDQLESFQFLFAKASKSKSKSRSWTHRDTTSGGKVSPTHAVDALTEFAIEYTCFLRYG